MNKIQAVRNNLLALMKNRPAFNGWPDEDIMERWEAGIRNNAPNAKKYLADAITLYEIQQSVLNRNN